MKFQFYLRFHTRFGQRLWISGNIDELGNDDPNQALPMNYLNEEFWSATVNFKKKGSPKKISYKYFLRNEDGEITWEWGNDREIEGLKNEISEIQLVDTWNHAGEYENVFSAPLSIKYCSINLR